MKSNSTSPKVNFKLSFVVLTLLFLMSAVKWAGAATYYYIGGATNTSDNFLNVFTKANTWSTTSGGSASTPSGTAHTYIFDGALGYTNVVVNFTSSQSYSTFSGQIQVTNNTSVTFQDGGSVNRTLSFGGSIAGNDLIIDAGSTFYLALRIGLSFTAPNTALINGTLKIGTNIGTATLTTNVITASVSNKALTSNVATLTTSAAHNFIVGQTATITGVDATFNGTYTIASVPTTTTFTYAKTAADVASAVVSPVGTAQSSQLTVNGTLEIVDNGGGSFGSNTLAFGASSKIDFTGTVQNTAFTSINFPSLVNNTSGRPVNIYNSGGVRLLTTTMSLDAGKTLNIKSGGVFQLHSNVTTTYTFTNNGTFTIESGGTFEKSSRITFTNGGTYNLNTGGILKYVFVTGVNLNNAVGNEWPTSLNNGVKIINAMNQGATYMLSFTGSKTISQNSTIEVVNDSRWVNFTNLSYNATGTTLVYSGTTASKSADMTVEWPASNGPANVTVDKSGQTITVGATPRTITGTLALTAGSLALAANNVTVNGDITGTGTVTSSGGVLEMTGKTSAANISGATIANLKLNDADGFTATGSPTITGNLDLTLGKLTLGNNDITVSGGISNNNASGYIVTDGSGRLIRSVSASTVFPVGDASNYMPVSFSSDVTQNFNARVKTPSSGIDVTYALSKVWEITAGSAATIAPTFSWTAGVQGANFPANPVSLLKYSGTWANSGVTPANVSSYSVSFTGANCCSEFVPGSTGGCNNVTTVGLSSNPVSPVCSGTNVTLTASPNGDAPFTYQWADAGGNINGATASTYSATVNATATYSCTVTNCSTAGNATNSIVISVQIPADIAPAAQASDVCSGSGTNIQISSSESDVDYQLRNNANNALIGSAVQGNGSTINLPTGNLTANTTFNVLATKRTAPNCSRQMTATPTVNVTAYVVPGVSISADPGSSVCSGTNVTFTATPVNGGASPTYQWKLNGGNVGSGGNTYSSSSFSNNDAVTCEMTSNALCITGTNPFVSNTITLTVNPSPTAASNFNSNSVTQTTMNISFSRGTGDTVLVIARAGAAPSAGPVNGTTYYVNDVIGSGTVVYIGTAAGASLSGLSAGTTYHFAVYEFNSTHCYSAVLSPIPTVATLCNPVNVSSVSASVENTQTTVTWANSSCYDEVMIVAKAGSSITGTPSGDGTSYTANLAFGSGTAFDGGYVVYKGSSSPQTITALNNNTTYYVKVFTRKGASWSSGIETTVVPMNYLIAGTTGGTMDLWPQANPFFNSAGTWEDYRVASTYSQSDFGSPGTISIDRIGWFIKTASGSLGNYNNFNIKLKSTSQVCTGAFLSGTTAVSSTGTVNINGSSTQGAWVEFVFSTPFTWNAGEYLYVETCYDNPNGSTVGNNSISIAGFATVNGYARSGGGTNFSGCTQNLQSSVCGVNIPSLRIAGCVPPTPTLSSSDADNSFCAGTSVTFTAGGGTTYNFRVNGSSVQNSASDTYTTSALTNGQVVDVIVTNSVGCFATSSGITNTVISVPSVSISETDNSGTANDGIVCSGNSATLTASGATTYSWNTGATNSAITVTPGSTTTYTVTGTTNGCSATATSTVTVIGCNFNFNVNLFLQGYYLGDGKMSPLLRLLGAASPTVVDSVTIELRDSTTGNHSLIYSYSDTLSSNGNFVCNFPAADTGYFYIVVKHRNSIETWSNSARHVSPGGSYNFSTPDGQAYGSMANMGGVYCIYSGDVTNGTTVGIQDGNINTSDKKAVQDTLPSFQIGVYDVRDITGDGFVDEDDYRIMQNNVQLGVSVQRPN